MAQVRECLPSKCKALSSTLPPNQKNSLFQHVILLAVGILLKHLIKSNFQLLILLHQCLNMKQLRIRNFVLMKAG
jgi:hypothetical protein